MNHVKLKLFGQQLPSPSSSSSSSSSSSFSAAMFVAKNSFHSTPVLEKKRKTQWHSRFNYYAKKKKNKEPKRALFRNFNDYAEFLFQSWREEEERNHTSEPSWFRNHHWVRNNDNNKNNYNNNGFNPYNSRNNYRNNGAFDSSDDDDEEAQTFFRSDFGREKFSYWSFENSNFRNNTSRNSYYYFRNSNKWTYDDDSDSDNEDFGTSSTQFGTKNEVCLARETLGLSVSGPLKLEEVKNAYRMCALRWHPDRHHGSSKVEAEEKFKHCGAAYKTLCDSLNDKL
ncbi:hypothetical protein LUZ60_002469 [Juncus effusus]|nr:hypothetical protein LUZ60_002469 [Juncus effusus]